MSQTIPTDEAIIEFDHVAKRFPDGTEAVRDLDFRVRREELVAIVGVTGCGKSTAFNMMLGLTAPTDGTVRVEGRDPHAEFDWFRRRIAVVFQDPRLLPWRTVLQNVCVGMKFAGIPKEHWEPRAREWLGRLGLGGREHAYIHELSGGQRQRVSIARAFSVDPDIILCDESFSALDEITASRLRGEFRDLVRENGKTGVVITHSITEALSVGDRVLVFRAPGHVAEEMVIEGPLSPEETERRRRVILERMGPAAQDPEHRAASEATPAGAGACWLVSTTMRRARPGCTGRSGAYRLPRPSCSSTASARTPGCGPTRRPPCPRGIAS
jgi:NitT/TauT family transport system ATP-binding protein